MARSLRIANAGSAPVSVRCAMSASLDLPDASWTLVQLSGVWARERDVVERPLVPGRQSVGSLRGGSGAEHNPFLALRRASTTESQGEAWGAALVYSGNHLCEVDVEAYGTARLRLGIHPEAFSWRLEPGAAFTTPEAVLAWSDDGPRRRVGRAPRAVPDPARPGPVAGRRPAGPAQQLGGDVLRLRPRPARRDGARGRAGSGVELFVLDDGWFGSRDSDTRGLGDWTVNPRKLPHGLDGLAAEVHALGLKFGLWIEPEMVNPDSDLFRGAPGLGDRRPGPPSDAEAQPARPRPRAAGRRRPPRDRHRRRARRARRSTTSSGTGTAT